MFKNIICSILLVFGGFRNLAYGSTCKQDTPKMELLRCSTERNLKDFGFNNSIIEAPERRGCCSWHHGVCGCSPEGKAVCCDGQFSPSCGC